MFVDHIRIFAKAGDGGNGCSSFRREKFVPKGGPDGGDGGAGGDVVLVVDPHTDNLRSFFYQHHYHAEKGAAGMGQKMTGRSGKHLVLKVPPGTVVYRTEAPEPKRKPGAEEETFFEDEAGAGLDEDEIDLSDTDADDVFDPHENDPTAGEVVADLTQPGQRFVLCRGGVGGKGNWRFRTDTNQAPIEFTEGTKGDEGWYYLELRRIADIGLVGFPNAGKSTLLGALSNASPKVASYPFTTLTPMVGVVEFSGFMRTTVADIPGLIEGAHRNIGLGHDFLRHISRCSIFLFVVDTAGVDNRDPVSDIQILRQELKLYDERLTERPWLIVANKMDLPESADKLEALRTRFAKQEIIPISADTGLGLDALKKRLCELAGRKPG
ncbi:MAG: GTPase ObgE [Verrucomicrobiales bacterium]|nr:GTPase ObgE [Verrucomicrobiales bacterium]